jgi:histone deacetylase HOS2
MWDYFRLYSGATMDAARNLISDQSDIAINWSGGLHHAHKQSAAGFCYINDIVLAIQQLLLVHARVLYVDIDVHHGDGVEEAFYSTDRVLTLSYHRYLPYRPSPTNPKDIIGFYPGTGGMSDVGPRDPKNYGAHHSLNVPLKEGINDQQWIQLFSEITGTVIDDYNPSAIVLQCGADSLGGDRLGQFNLNIKAHGFCVDFVKRKCHQRKLLIIGGGGYTPRNVARCWTHETALCVGADLGNDIPAHVPYRQAFMGSENGNGELYPQFDDATMVRRYHDNANTRETLEPLVINIKEQMRFLKGAPSVQMQYIPKDYLKLREEEESRIKEEIDEKSKDDFLRRREEKNLGGWNELDAM